MAPVHLYSTIKYHSKLTVTRPLKFPVTVKCAILIKQIWVEKITILLA